MTTNRFLLVAALQLAVTDAVMAQSQKPATADIDRLAITLDSLRTRLAIPGLAAALLVDGRVAWSGGFGVTDVSNPAAVTAHTPFALASLGKPMASVLLHKLVEQGRLSLDEPIARYSTEIPAQSATIRHVLTHTSEGTPGERFAYNGNAFSALFDPIVKVSGRRYREFLSTELLIPLAMTETAPGNDLRTSNPAMESLLGVDNSKRYAAVVQRMASAHRMAPVGDATSGPPGPRATPEYAFGISPSNGMVSSVIDVAKFDSAFDAGALVNEATRRAMWTPHRLSSGADAPYGLGWFVQRVANERLIWHFGLLPGRYSGLYLKRPDARMTLVLLANSDALSAPFALAQGDVTRSAFACAFLTSMPPRVPTDCTARAAQLVREWRAANGLSDKQ